MPNEIERKYLPIRNHPGFLAALDSSPLEIRQAYLADFSKTPSDSQVGVVRVRTRDDDAFLTIKSNAPGLSRKEFEYEIPMADALEMMAMVPDALYKQRYLEPLDSGHLVELDYFPELDLYVAEVEFIDEEDANEFEKPEWLGEDVTGQVEYFNNVILERLAEIRKTSDKL